MKKKYKSMFFSYFAKYLCTYCLFFRLIIIDSLLFSYFERLVNTGGITELNLKR